jgi:uncharacterized protein (TIGR03435 family)
MRSRTALALLAFAAHLSGQNPPARPSFEVASVKINNVAMVSDRIPQRSGDHVRFHNASLGMFVIYAYHVDNEVYQLVSKAPAMDAETCFDIDAIASGTPSDADLRLMFQTLLEDRFKLQAHWENREVAGFNLVIAKGGPKIKASVPENKIIVDGNTFPTGSTQMYIDRSHVAHLLGEASTMEQLTYQLSGRTRTAIRDRTGLTGTFDYNVAFALNNMQADVNSAPMLVTAIQEALGLKLEKSQVPARVLVVDHAEAPTPN